MIQKKQVDTVAVLVMVTRRNNFLRPILTLVTLALIPPVVFYLLSQKQLITVLTSGAVKG